MPTPAIGYGSVMEISNFIPNDSDGGLLLVTQLPGIAGDFNDNRRGWDALHDTARGEPRWTHLDRTRGRAQQ